MNTDNYSTESMEMSPSNLKLHYDQVYGTGDPPCKTKNSRTEYCIMDAKRRLEQQMQQLQQMQHAKQAAMDAPPPPPPPPPPDDVPANERIAELEEKVKQLEIRAAEAEKIAEEEHNGLIEMFGKLSDSERDRCMQGQQLIEERKEAARRFAELEETKNNEIREWAKKYENAIANQDQARDQSARDEATYLRGQLESCQTDFNVLKERAEWAESRVDRMKRERDECFRSNARVKAKYEHLGRDFDELRRVNGMLATTRAYKLHEKLQAAKERIKELENFAVSKTYGSTSSDRACRAPDTITVRSNSASPFASPTYDSYTAGDNEGVAHIGSRSPGPSNSRSAYSVNSHFDAFKN